MNFDQLYKLVCEADEITVSKSRYTGNAYQLLASIGIYPNETYNFYEEVKKWYLNNTELTPEEIEFTLNAKIEHAAKDKGAFFPKIIKSTKRAKLLGPDSWHKELVRGGFDSEEIESFDNNSEAVYVHADGNIMMNPFKKFPSAEYLLQIIIHELVHSIQSLPNPEYTGDVANKVLNSYYNSSNKKIAATDKDPNVKYDTSSFDAYTMWANSSPVEVDVLLAEVNRAIALMRGIMIYPNDSETSQKALRYVIDPRNESKLPERFKDSMIILRDLIKGESKDVPNSPQEQERMIKIFAQRLSLLAKNTVNDKIKRTV